MFCWSLDHRTATGKRRQLPGLEDEWVRKLVEGFNSIRGGPTVGNKRGGKKTMVDRQSVSRPLCQGIKSRNASFIGSNRFITAQPFLLWDLE